MHKEYLSIPEAAIVLGISRIAVFKRVKKGRLPAIRIGRNWAVPASALAAKEVSGAGGKLSRQPLYASENPPPESLSPGGNSGIEDMGWD
jgi:excisionase family DNA binding protein